MDFIPPSVEDEFRSLLKIISDPIKHQKMFDALSEKSKVSQEALNNARDAQTKAEALKKEIDASAKDIADKQAEHQKNLVKFAEDKKFFDKSQNELMDQINAQAKKARANELDKQSLDKLERELSLRSSQLNQRDSQLRDREQKLVEAEADLSKRFARLKELAG